VVTEKVEQLPFDVHLVIARWPGFSVCGGWWGEREKEEPVVQYWRTL